MNKKVTKRGSGDQELLIEGLIELETRKGLPQDISLSAFAVDGNGEILASSKLNPDGGYRLPLKTVSETPFDLLIAKTDETADVRKNALYAQHITDKQLIAASDSRLLKQNIFIAKDIWFPWWPRQICISGHVRKIPNCPIPFAKVEIFDVDRGPCLWPWFSKFKALIRQRQVVRLEDIQANIPEIDPQILEEAFIDTSENIEASNFPAALASIDHQPALPFTSIKAAPMADVKQLLEPVTLTSKLAPWILFPNCFYRRQRICTTTTDQNGYFKCCFKWFPLQFRHGRFNVDFRPDIILRVTQTINGVEKVIYMDAYANTRWNSLGAHIDLYLDDPEIECGGNGNQDRPTGSVAFFTRIGNDEVYKIDQSDGTYNATSATSNMAYGSALRIFAQFGDTLSRLQNIPGAQKPYFYKVSVNGNPISTPLKDTRVNKGSLVSESHVLGPVTRGAETALFEIRNFKDYYWYNPDWVANWITATTSGSTINKLIADGLKTVKLEVFDSDGTLLDNTKVNYLDGTVDPSTSPTLPSIYPCDMRVAIDNNAPSMSMLVDPLPTGCGVIPIASVPPLNVKVTVTQSNNRVYRWNLSYVKGTNPTPQGLGSAINNAGLAGVNSLSVNADQMTEVPAPGGGTMKLDHTCAFAITLWSEPHIRNGYSTIYRRSIQQAIAIDA